jgi:hypothetical protein
MLVKIANSYIEANDVCSITHYNPRIPLKEDLRVISIRDDKGRGILEVNNVSKDDVDMLKAQYADVINVAKRRSERLARR